MANQVPATFYTFSELRPHAQFRALRDLNCKQWYEQYHEDSGIYCEDGDGEGFYEDDPEFPFDDYIESYVVDLHYYTADGEPVAIRLPEGYYDAIDTNDYEDENE